MVSGINGIGNIFAAYDLASIKSQLNSIDTPDGKLSQVQKDELKQDVSYFVEEFGEGSNIEDTLEQVNNLMEAQTSKEVSPDMDLSLDMEELQAPDIPDLEL